MAIIILTIIVVFVIMSTWSTNTVITLTNKTDKLEEVIFSTVMLAVFLLLTLSSCLFLFKHGYIAMYPS